MIVVAALYKFTNLQDFDKIQNKLKILCDKLQIRGTLLVAREGINGTIAGTRESIDKLNIFFSTDRRFDNLEYKESFHKKNPFYRLKVKLKKEIVTLGQPNIYPSKKAGEYVDAQKFNKLIQDPDVIVIDVRNNYETKIGSFKNAQDPKTKIFREFPKFVKDNLDNTKHKKIAMFCTGGIRCEKASSYMKHVGFEQVYHLKGGILKYLEDIPKEQSLWWGDCFVFDNRVAVNHDLTQGKYESCHGCRRPISEQDKLAEYYQKGICCPNCYNLRTDEQKARSAERHKQIGLSRQRGEEHLIK